MTLFWHQTGPLIKYERDALGEWFTVEDLNPENRIHFKLSPIELLGFGFRCIWAAIRP